MRKIIESSRVRLERRQLQDNCGGDDKTKLIITRNATEMYAEICMWNQMYRQNRKFDFINAEVSKPGMYKFLISCRSIVAYYTLM